MKELFAKLQSGLSLDSAEIKKAAAWLVDETEKVGERADFLRILHEKGETAGEIAGFADTFINIAVPFHLDKSALAGPLIDVCGTGGDGKNFFNVSTCVMFVAAAAGACVVKHGNRSITSQCGGADVLEALGIDIHCTPASARECLKKCGAAFLFAPDYYPAFKAVAPVRKMLAQQGKRSVFNILGPLLNPARPDYQLTGVFSRHLLQTYAESLIELGRKHVWVVCGAGSEDEISITDSSEVVEIGEGISRQFIIEPENLGLRRASESLLIGGDAKMNAAVIHGILDGTISDGRSDIVVLNAAASLVVSGIASTLNNGIERAKEVIRNGRAKGILECMRSSGA